MTRLSKKFNGVLYILTKLIEVFNFSSQIKTRKRNNPMMIRALINVRIIAY